jgi:ATP-binding protein involved in chromosome partitioning
MSLTTDKIIEALQQVRYPGTGKNIVEMQMIRPEEIQIDGRKVALSLRFPRANDPFKKSIIKAAETAILTYVAPDIEIRGNIVANMPQAARPETTDWLPGVKNIIAIASGKGGVGKSTVAANLAVALAEAGFRVGLLDADIYGPSQPTMFGVETAQPAVETIEGKDRMLPVEQYGVRLLSIGFFVQRDDALAWRGTMAGNALKQLIGEACWGALDYFLIDLPPGTGDIHLTLVQTLAITGAIVVTTPQAVALSDARKALALFANEKVDVPVLGLVENMAWFTPAELPDNKYYLFGKDGGKALAEKLHLPLLGEIPIVRGICESGDAGRPVALDAGDPAGAAFRALAGRVVGEVERRHLHRAASRKVMLQ